VKHGLVSVDAIHNQPYASDRKDLIPATEEQIKKNGDGSHRAKEKTTGAKASQDLSESREMSGTVHDVGNEKAITDSASLPTKAALKLKPEAAEGRATPDDLPEGLDPHLMMLIALGREVERQQALNLPKATPTTRKERRVEKNVERGRVSTSRSAPPGSTPAHLNPRVTVRTMDAAMTAPSVSVKEKGKVVDLTKSLRPRTTDIDMEKNSSEEEGFGKASSFLSQSASAVQVKFPSEMPEGMSVSDVTGGSPTPLTTKLIPAGKVPGKIMGVIAPPVADLASAVKMPALKVIVDENAEQARILELSLDIAESVKEGRMRTPLLSTGNAASVALKWKMTTEKRTTVDDLRLTPPRAQKKRKKNGTDRVYRQ